ncbi:glycosyltransferase family 2 protein [uncultured Brevundimonas sp.]|uniref:glycosyltransferase family 2 protein n=1 Tax=uncultured Brevundimonas sp. TaxID=213418 RepID=UPI0030EE853B|tara:strand:+ start:9647 stop:10603 length:957 start_codon:yes stop_codon:yes gene_type:complete
MRGKTLVKPRGAPDVSVVIPCYNEQENVEAIVAAVGDELQRTNVTYEIVLIDNASTDQTVNLALKLCAVDSRVKLIANNRNYGQLRSPTYGIFQATGRAVIAMCADFQDPPSLLGVFIEKWKAGAPIVLGIGSGEGQQTSALHGLIRNTAYGFLNRFADYQVIPGATGFGIYDRKVVDELARWNEPEPFFRGMLVESGYDITLVPYERPGRAAGKSKNNWGTLIKFGLSGLAASSKDLLRLPFYVAVAVGGLSALTVLGAIVALILGSGTGLWMIALLVEVGFGLLFVFLGLLGEQVRLISERTRSTPLVIEKLRVNF